MSAFIAIAPSSTLADYEASVRRAGGEPLVIDRAEQSPASVVAKAGGVLLAGGGDVQPTIYGEAPHSTFAAAEAGRDEYELELVRRALDADLPVFAICRGVQVLAVARGGSLVQDIPTEVGSTIAHMVREPRDAMAHDVSIAAGTLLARLMDVTVRPARAGTTSAPAAPAGPARTILVNSRHHQAARTPGRGLIVSATAADGVIEAVEDPSKPFCLGVQWHPENFWRTGEFAALFEGFVKACRI